MSPNQNKMADNQLRYYAHVLSKSEGKLKLLFEFLFQTLYNEFRKYKTHLRRQVIFTKIEDKNLI